ncbi:transcriptional repressor [Candidatus Peregrinibacteria bacterium]|nr:transcriptional repressor [Candidatus Peregrinibacteria bacterium]
MDFSNHANQVIKEKGYRLTKQKELVLKTLSQTSTPLNAYEIASKIKDLGHKIDTSTVYRILEVYKSIKLIHYSKEANGYTLCHKSECSNKKHCHHQFICKKCNKVEEVHLDDEKFIKKFQRQFKDLLVQDHYFEFLGLCNSCNP